MIPPQRNGLKTLGIQGMEVPLKGHVQYVKGTLHQDASLIYAGAMN